MARRGARILAAAALGAAVTLPSLAPSAGAQDLVATLARIKPGIVGIGTFQEVRRPPAKLLGTGFAVADGSYVVTSFHVVPAKLDGRGKEYLVAIAGVGDSSQVFQAEMAAEDQDHDVAVLRLQGARLHPLIIGDDSQLAEGQEIAFTGFPIGAVLGLYPVTHRGIVSARTPIAIPQLNPNGLDATMIRRLRTRFEVFQLDATAYPGNSGSPLYDQRTGQVMGIVSSVFVKLSKENVLKDPSGITFAVPIRHARELLRKLDAIR